MEIIIYKISGCTYCVKAEELMQRANLEYSSVMVGKDITQDELKQKYPNVISFPLIVIDDQIIGGLVDTVKYFVDNKIVSSKK